MRQNEKRLKSIEDRGHAPADLEQKVDDLAKEIQKFDEVKERLEQAETKLNRPPAGPDSPDGGAEAKARAGAMRKYIRYGEKSLGPDEVKLLSVGSDPEGGYTVTPEMSTRIIEKIFETSPMRDLAMVETISTDALEIPDDLNEANGDWVAEQDVRVETATPKIGVRRIPVHEVYANPKATQKLLDDSSVDVESWLARKIGDKMGRLQNTAFINGTGVGQPRGILTYPAGTTNPGQVQQVNSGSAAALTADGLRSLFFALKSGYIQGANWLMSRNAVEAISKLKDSQNQYLWQPGLQQGEPQSLLSHPIRRMEDMPAVAANSLSIAFGNFREAYTIVDRSGIRTLRDPFSNKPFVSFYSIQRVGGDVTNFEAFVIQKTAA